MLGAAGLAGIVLRYGAFCGPGTAIGPDGAVVADVRRWRVPLVGNGTGVWSFVHVVDAAAATLAAIERAAPARRLRHRASAGRDGFLALH